MPPPSPRRLSLLDSRVRTYPPGDGPANIGHILTSGKKMAIGFTDIHEANRLVQGLELGAELSGERDLSSVTLRGGHQYSCIHTVDKNLILIASGFVEIYPSDVFLIYDVIDCSLRMIPSKPYTYPPIRTTRVLVARLHEEDDGDKSYTLVFPGSHGRQDFLFLAPSSSASPWETRKRAKFPDHARPENGQFAAEHVFSFRGRGYWVDLLTGVLYCNYSDVLSRDIGCVVIRSFDLPEGCKKYSGCREDISEVRAFRAMGPVGDSIKFVSIDGYLEQVDLKDCKVRIWKLMKNMKWAVEYELKLASLWPGGEFKGGWVPSFMNPMYPFLNAEEDAAIYFAVGSTAWGVKMCFTTRPSCMVRVDLHKKTVCCRYLSERERTFMASHLAVPSNAEDKLLRGSCYVPHVEYLRPCPSAI